MASELIRLIDADSAHAVEETAKAAGKAIDAASNVGGYAADILGDLPHDLVGIMGDWVKQHRARRWAEMQAKTDKILRERGAENREEASPSIAIPLIAAAIDEDRDELKELWARLLAAALDPKRAKFFRLKFIEVAKLMDPLDAKVLEGATGMEGRVDSHGRGVLAARFDVSKDEVAVSVSNLIKLDLMAESPIRDPDLGLMTPLGREFLRAVAD